MQAAKTFNWVNGSFAKELELMRPNKDYFVSLLIL